MPTFAPQTKATVLVVGALALLSSTWLSTQRVAAELGFHAALGQPLWRGERHALYAPWAWLEWAARFPDLAPSPYLAPALLTGLTFVVVALAFAIVAKGQARTSTAHGSARWATIRELKKAGFMLGRGIVLGQTDDAVLAKPGMGDAMLTRREGQILTHDGPEHSMIFAPTRSGKGVSVVLPTLYTWTASVVAYDMKKELWAKTAGYRSKFSHCLRFEPCARDTVRFNPLLEVRRGYHEVGDVQNICEILVDPSGGREERSHWDKTAASLLTGTILHVLYAEDDKTLSRVAELLSDPDRPVIAVLEMMLDTKHLGDRPHPVVAAVAREMLNKEDREQSSVISSALSFLTLYRDPLIAAATSESDFRLADLMNGEHPVSLYLVVPPNDQTRTRPLMRLILNQIGRHLTESMDHKKRSYKHRLLFLLDEFPTLGRLDFFESALAFVAGYGIKCMIVAQSLSQLAKQYGERNAILDNCHIRICYAANDDQTCKRISDLLGQSTHVKTQKTFRGGLFGGSRSYSEQEHARPLLTSGEVGQLPPDQAVLLAGGIAPYRAKKIFYYSDERFRAYDQFDPPDSPAAQAAELPSAREHDWLPRWRACTPAAPRPKKKRVIAPTSEDPTAAPPPPAPPSLSPDEAASMLADFDSGPADPTTSAGAGADEECPT